MVEDVPVALILRPLIISLTLQILISLAMISIRSSIVSLLCLGSYLWLLYVLANWLMDSCIFLLSMTFVWPIYFDLTHMYCDIYVTF